MFQLLYPLIHAVQPLLAPICFFCAWALTLLVAWSIWTAIRDGLNTSRKMHQIPCVNCRYFTGDYRLKCTAQPSVANTEEAINCIDYQPRTNPMFY